MTERLYRPQRNWGARIREMTYLGIRTVILENQHLRIGILAGKGTDIVELNYKPLDLDFVWLTPGGVRNPVTFASTAPDARAIFRDNYPGAWQEIFPSGGNPSSFEGANYNQHGELFNVPWDVAIVEDTEDLVAARFTVRTRKSPFLLEKTIRLPAGEAGFQIQERIVNESPATTNAMWGHHITFGQPFLKPGSRIRLPDGITVVPPTEDVSSGSCGASGAGTFTWPIDPRSGVDLSVIPDRGTPSGVHYLAGFRNSEAWYELVDPETGIGARIEWDADVMPYLWYWREFGASTGYPWYGRNFNIGLEPFSSMPGSGLAEAVANETALRMQPFQERAFWLTLSILLEGDSTRSP